jgi:hypothetical protein
MLPDPGCYEERYRMAAGSAVGLFTGLMTIGLAFLTGAPWVVGIVIAAAFLALMGPGLAVRRMIALRAGRVVIAAGLNRPGGADRAPGRMCHCAGRRSRSGSDR